jgi:hypothetical protein
MLAQGAGMPAGPMDAGVSPAMSTDWLRRGGVTLSVALTLAVCIGASAPRAAAVAPPVAVGQLSVSPDMSLATVPIASAAVDLTATGPDGPLPILGGALHIPLRLGDHDRQTVRVGLNASGVPLGDLEIRYYPRAYYRALASQQPGAILMFTTLPRTGSLRVATGTPTDLPPAESLAVDLPRWTDARRAGELPPATLDLDEQIRRLYRQMERENDDSIGRLCDERLSGIAAYEQVRAGECSVQCYGYARLLRDFLRSGGTPARVISLGAGVTTLPNEVRVQSSEGHQTTELWDGTGWSWIDGTLGVLRAVGPDGSSLSTAEAVAALADPQARDEIRFTRLDPATGTWVTTTYREQDEAFKILLAGTLTPDKVLSIPNGGRG